MTKVWKPLGYQLPIIKTVVSALKRVGKALMVMATGTGKTPTSAFVVKELIRNIESPKVLFLVHMNEILNQGQKNYKAVFDGGYSYGIYNGIKKEADTDFVFATFQTMMGNLKNFSRNYFDVIVVDESHHATADGFHKVLKYFKPKHLLGMTATPDREQGVDIREVFNDPVVVLSLEESIAKGYLTPVEYRVVTDNLNQEAFDKIMKEVMEEGVRLSMEDINKRLFVKERDKEAAETIKKENKKAVIFCPSIRYAEDFSRFLPDSEVYHSKNSQAHNDWILKGFKSSAIKHILVVDMFNEGVDVPNTEMVVFMRSTESKRIFFQQLGRGLRFVAGKKLLVLDLVSNIKRLLDVQSLIKKVQEHSDIELTCGRNERKVTHVSGLGFEFAFNAELIDLIDMLNVEFYNFSEFLKVCKQLKFASQKDYNSRYKQDPKLPSNPNLAYKEDWVKGGGWGCATGKVVEFYNFPEFSQVCKQLKFASQKDYRARYKQDPKLPSAPGGFYKEDWVKAGGWRCVTVRDWAYSFLDFLAVCKNMKFASKKDFKARYKQDSKLPSTPSDVYKDDWVKAGKWRCVTGKN